MTYPPDATWRPVPDWLADAACGAGRHSAIAVYHAIIRHVSADGAAWPSAVTLSLAVNLHERTVRKHLAWLVEVGALAKEYRHGQPAVYRTPRASAPDPTSEPRASAPGVVTEPRAYRPGVATDPGRQRPGLPVDPGRTDPGSEPNPGRERPHSPPNPGRTDPGLGGTPGVSARQNEKKKPNTETTETNTLRGRAREGDGEEVRIARRSDWQSSRNGQTPLADLALAVVRRSSPTYRLDRGARGKIDSRLAELIGDDDPQTVVPQLVAGWQAYRAAHAAIVEAQPRTVEPYHGSVASNLAVYLANAGANDEQAAQWRRACPAAASARGPQDASASLDATADRILGALRDGDPPATATRRAGIDLHRDRERLDDLCRRRRDLAEALNEAVAIRQQQRAAAENGRTTNGRRPRIGA